MASLTCFRGQSPPPFLLRKPSRQRSSCFRVLSRLGHRPFYPPMPKYPDPAAPVFFNSKRHYVGPEGYMSKWGARGFDDIAITLSEAGVERIVVEVYWGIVERDGAKLYNWVGYSDLFNSAIRANLKVKVVFSFHHCNFESGGLEIPLPPWVTEAMDKHEMHFRDRNGNKSFEYISFGCDELRLLHGRSPMEVYGDFMRSFYDSFKALLGKTITDIEIGMGPDGELRYPWIRLGGHIDRLVFPKLKFSVPNDLSCFDQYMLNELGANDPATARVLWADTRDPHGIFFKRFSDVLIAHGDKLLLVANDVFSGSSVNMTARLAAMYWGFYSTGNCELVAGYTDYMGIMEMVSRNNCGLCLPRFDVGSNSSWLHCVIDAAQSFHVPIVGENSEGGYDINSLQHIIATSKLCKMQIKKPLSFNFVAKDASLKNWESFTAFYDFVKQMADHKTFRN